MDKATVKRLAAFINERWRVFQHKEAGEPKPWTQDPILQRYRFCNVHRENDTVTRWIALHWRKPLQHAPELPFAMAVARVVNWPPTMHLMGLPVPWKPGKFLTAVQLMKSNDLKTFSAAYIVSTAGTSEEKEVYLEREVLTPMWKARKDIAWRVDDTLATFYLRLRDRKGMGGFMAGQVVADVKYSPQARKAKDWWTFAVSGPGSRRGLNRVLGRPKDQHWNEVEWQGELLRVKEATEKHFGNTDMPPLHAQDFQNCLCEFDKYERVRRGEGRPRSNYPGGPVQQELPL